MRDAKCVSEGASVEIKRSGDEGSQYDVNLDLADGADCDLRYLGRGGLVRKPETYDATLRLDQQRVRRVGFNPVGRQNFRAKRRIPAGWHQNVCDPNVAADHMDWIVTNHCPTLS